MTASYAGNGLSEAAVAVAVCNGVGGGRRSRRAVRWAAEHLVPHAHRIVLVHVIPAISSIPSPSGELVPVDRVVRDLVEMYVQDQELKAKQVFFPFRELCGTRNVDTVVLEGEYPAAALLKYVSESRTKNLVLGSSSNWFRRILKGLDVPTTVLNSSTYCNIFVVSRYKLTMKFAADQFLLILVLAIIYKQSVTNYSVEEVVPCTLKPSATRRVLAQIMRLHYIVQYMEKDN